MKVLDLVFNEYQMARQYTLDVFLNLSELSQYFRISTGTVAGAVRGA